LWGDGSDFPCGTLAKKFTIFSFLLIRYWLWWNWLFKKKQTMYFIRCQAWLWKWHSYYTNTYLCIYLWVNYIIKKLFVECRSGGSFVNLKIIGHGSGHGSSPNSPPIYIYILVQIPNMFFCQDFTPTPTFDYDNDGSIHVEFWKWEGD